MKAHAELHIVVGITIKKKGNAWFLSMVDVKEIPITFTPNQPAKLSACNTIEVRLYLYVSLAINNLTKFIVPFSLAKELKMLLYYISNSSGEVSH